MSYIFLDIKIVF